MMKITFELKDGKANIAADGVDVESVSQIWKANPEMAASLLQSGLAQLSGIAAQFMVMQTEVARAATTPPASAEDESDE